MADTVDTVDDSALLTERTEILLTEAEKQWGKLAALQDGRKMSGWIRFLINRELTRKFGPQWNQDHPGGDQGSAR